MSLQINLQEPVYYHRETNSDVPRIRDNSWSSTFRDAGCTLLPFAALYKPAAYPLTVGLGATRTFNYGHLLYQTLTANKVNAHAVAYCAVQTTLSTAALACSIASQSLGMMITTAQDTMGEIWGLVFNLQHGDRRAACENTLHIVNNALYLALLVQGGAGLAIASLSLQVLNSLYHSATEFQKGNKLKAAAHMAMTVLRTSQLSFQIDRARFPVIHEGTIEEIYRPRGKNAAFKIDGNWYWLDIAQTEKWKAGDHIVVQNIGEFRLCQQTDLKFTNESHYFNNVVYK